MSDTHLTWRDAVDRLEQSQELDSESADHLARCADCADLWREARKLLGTLTMAGVPEPSQALREKTWLRMTASMDSASPRPGTAVERLAHRARDAVREIWATLVADSLTPSHAIRGATLASPRLLVYEADEYSVSISMSETRPSEGSTGRRFDLRGAVMPKTAGQMPSGAVATGVALDFSAESALSETGEFRFSGVPDGLCIDLQLESTRLRVGPLTGGGRQ